MTEHLEELPTEDEVREEEEAARRPTPLPTSGDKLFVTDSEQLWTDTFFSPQRTYLIGYQWAADLLFEKAQQSTQDANKAAEEAKEGKLDGPVNLPMSIEPWLVYPIYFLYRHVIELSLKDLLRAQDKHGKLSSAGKKLIDTSHNVVKLWNTAKPWVQTFCKPVLDKEISVFSDMIEEIGTHDPNADAGRYPLSNTVPHGSGRKSVMAPSFGKIKPIDLKNFHQNAVKLLHLITWIWTLYEDKYQGWTG